MIITISGMDKCGKTTLAKYLKTYYADAGFETGYQKHPDYKHPIGKLVGAFMDSAHIEIKATEDMPIRGGDLPSTQIDFSNQMTTQLLCLASMLESAKDLPTWASDPNKVMILDRHVLDFIVYGIATTTQDYDYYYNLVQPLFHQDYNHLGIVLVNSGSMYNRGRDDKYESDASLQERVATNFTWVPSLYGYNEIIDVNHLSLPEDMYESVLKKAKYVGDVIANHFGNDKLKVADTTTYRVERILNDSS